MDMPVVGPKGQVIQDGAHGKEKAEKADKGDKASSTKSDVNVKLKSSLNAQILQAHEKVSLSVKDNDLLFVYKNAIDKLNEILEPIFGEEAVQNAAPEEYTPEAVSERILQFATGFFEAYKRQNPNMSEEEALAKYSEIIEGAIDQGFSEAQEILEGLNVFEGDVKNNAEKTYDLIQEGLKTWKESILGKMEKPE